MDTGSIPVWSTNIPGDIQAAKGADCNSVLMDLGARVVHIAS